MWTPLTNSAVQEVWEFGRIWLILLQVIEAVDLLKIYVQLSEVFGEDTGPWLKDASKIGLRELLPLVQSDRTCGQWQELKHSS